MKTIAAILPLAELAAGRAFAQIKKFKLMETAPTTAKVTTFNLGAASEDANTLISQGYQVNGTIYISGQYSHDTQGAVTGVGDFEAQVHQTFQNLDKVLAGFHVTKVNIAEVIIYLTNPREHAEPLAPLLQEYLGAHRPAGTILGTTGLWYPEQLLEIRAVAYAN